MFYLRYRQATALLVGLWLLVPAVSLAGSPHYTVAADVRLEYLDVSVCFEGSVPRRLIARDERATELLHAARLETGEKVRPGTGQEAGPGHDTVEIELRGSSLALPRTTAPACVQYRVDLNSIGSRQWRSNS